MSQFNFFGEDDNKPSSLFNFFDAATASPLDPKPEEIFEGGRILVRKGAFYVDKDTGAIVRPAGVPGGLGQNTPEAIAASSPTTVEKAVGNLDNAREWVSEAERAGLHQAAASGIGLLKGFTENKTNIPFMPDVPNPAQLIGQSIVGMGGINSSFGGASEEELRKETASGLADAFKSEQERAAELMGPDPSFGKKLVSQIPQAAGQMLSYAAGGPAASASLMGGIIFGSGYGGDTAEGTDPSAAFFANAADAAAESYLEGLLPGRVFENLKATGPIWERAKGYLGTALLEGSTEYVQNYVTHLKNLVLGKYGNPMSDKFDRERWERDTDLLAKTQLEAFTMGTILGPAQEFAARGVAGAAGSLAQSRAELNTAINADDPVAANRALDKMQLMAKDYNEAVARGEVDADTHAETIAAFKDDTKLDPVSLQKFHNQFAARLVPDDAPLDPATGFPQTIMQAANEGTEQGLKDLARASALYNKTIPDTAAILTQTDKRFNDEFTTLVIKGEKQEPERQQWVSEQLAQSKDPTVNALANSGTDPLAAAAKLVRSEIESQDPDATTARLHQIYPHDNRVYEGGTALPINRIITKEGLSKEGNRGTEAMSRPVLNRLLSDYESYDDSQLSALHALFAGPAVASKNAPQIEQLLNSRGMTAGTDLSEITSLSASLSRAGTPLSIYSQIKKSGRSSADAYNASIIFDSLVGGLSNSGSYDGVIDFINASETPLQLNPNNLPASAYVNQKNPQQLAAITIGPAFNESAIGPKENGLFEVTRYRGTNDASNLIHELAHAAQYKIPILVDSKSRNTIYKFMDSGNVPDERLAIGVQYALAHLASDQKLQSRLVANGTMSQQTVDAMVHFGNSFSTLLQNENSVGGPGAADAISVSGVRYGDVRKDLTPQTVESLLKLFAGKPHNAGMISAFHDYSEMKDLEAKVVGMQAVQQEAKLNPGPDPDIEVWVKGLDRAFKPGTVVNNLATQAAKTLTGDHVAGFDMGDPLKFSREDQSPESVESDAITIGDIERRAWKWRGEIDKPAELSSQSLPLRFARWARGYFYSDKTGAARMVSIGSKGAAIPTNTALAGRSYLPGPARDLFETKLAPLLEKAQGESAAIINKFNLLSHDYLDALASAASKNNLTADQVADIRSSTTRARLAGDLSLIQDEGVRNAASAIFSAQDELTKELVSSGLVPKQTAEKMIANLGVYLHRDYVAFHVRDFFDIAASDKKKFDAAHDRLTEEYIAMGYKPGDAGKLALGQMERLIRDRLDPSNLSSVQGGAKILPRMDRTEVKSRLGEFGRDFYSYREGQINEKEKLQKLGEDVSGIDTSDRALLLKWANEKLRDIQSEQKDYPPELTRPYERIKFAAENMNALDTKLTEAQLVGRILDDEDMPPAVRQWMGEIDDPVLSVKLGVAHMAHDLAYGRMWSQIRAEGLKSGAFVRGAPQPGFTAKIEEQSLGPLTKDGQEDLYAPPDVKSLISVLHESRRYNTLATVISSLKLAKILAPSTWMRNVESGIPMLVLNGHLQWNMAESESEAGGESVVGQRLRQAKRVANMTVVGGMEGKIARWGTRGLRNNAEDMFWTREALKRGIQDPGVNKELLIDVEQWAQKKKRKDASITGQGKITTAAKAYNTPDVFNKTLAFRTEADILSWYYSPDISSKAPISDAILNEAANTVNDTYQTYARLPQAAKDFARATGTFSTFPMEIARNLTNAAIRTAHWGQEAARMTAKGDMIHATKATVIFMNRLSGLFAATLLGKIMLDLGNWFIHGVKDETVAAFSRLAGGRGSENSTPMIIDRKGKNWKYVDWTNQDPYVINQKLVNIFFNNPTIPNSEKALMLAKELQQTYLPPGIPYKAIGEFATGRDIQNNWLPGRDYTIAGTKATAVPVDSAMQAKLYRLYRNVGPTAATDTGEGSLRAVGILSPKMGSRIFTPEDMMLRTLGISVQTKDVSLPFRTKISEFRSWKDSFSQAVNVDLERLPSNDMIGRRSRLQKAEKEWRSKYAEFHQNIKDAQAIGVSIDEIEEMMKNARLRKDVINNLFDGIYTPFEDVFREKERD